MGVGLNDVGGGGVSDADGDGLAVGDGDATASADEAALGEGDSEPVGPTWIVVAQPVLAKNTADTSAAHDVRCPMRDATVGDACR